MARHLVSQGQEVIMLAILDAKASQVPSFHNCLNRSQAVRYRFSSFREKSIFLAQCKFHIPRLAKNLLRGEKSKSKLVPSHVGGRRGLAYLEDVMEPELIALMDENDMASPYIKLMEANFAALESYTLQPYPGKLILFKAVEAGKGVCYGWEVLAEGGVEVHEIPGTHLKMVEEPNVQILARELRACIDRSLVS
jgi:aspartate racemase